MQEIRRDFYVYVLIDRDFNIRYVGEGTGGRVNKCSGRTKEYKKLIDQGAETLVLYETLTKEMARNIETFLIEKFWDTGLLINSRRDNLTIVNDLSYDEADMLFSISNESPSGLIWKKKISKVVVPGKLAGSLSKAGYWRVQLHNKRYQVHRIIWVLNNKQNISSSLVVNHIDSNPANNSVDNLELISQKLNSLKKIKPDIAKKNYSTPTGISKVPQVNPNLFRYVATVVDPYGEIVSKSFSINKYGEDNALSMAVKWREEKLSDFYSSEVGSP